MFWTSSDQGQTWRKVEQLTRNSPRIHTFPRRPVNAHPDFHAFWTDGRGREPFESLLYFTNENSDHVWRLPPTMDGDLAGPEFAW